ncbi:MAG TPA: hypothetical protein VEC37_03100, partial [Bacillota bacterium]|nr:hypothetical protein [Bacillota bacterium]
MFISAAILLIIGTFIFWGLVRSGNSLQSVPDTLQQAADLITAGKFAEAVAIYESAPLDSITRKPENKATFEHSYGMALFRLAKVNRQTATLQKALGLLNSAANDWEQLNRKVEKAFVLIDLSRVTHFSATFSKNPALLEQALGYLSEALKIPAIKKSMPLSAALQLSYGMIHLGLFQFKNQREYLDQAVTLLENAWQYFQTNTTDENAVLTELYLSLGYLELSRFTNETANLQKAYQFSVLAAKGIHPDRDPTAHGLLKFNLGELYLHEAGMQDKKRNLLLAFRAFKTASRFFHPQLLPEEYARSCVELCKIYQYFGEATLKPKRYKQALHSVAEAISLISREYTPQLYLACLLIQCSLYAHLADLQSAPENLTQVIHLYTEAFNYISLKKQPEIYTAVSFKIGVAYSKLAKYVTPISNLANAITALESAFRTKRFATENDYLKAKSYLDDAQSQLEMANPTADNYNQLIQAFQKLIELYDPEDFPEDHARFQAKLGLTYQQAAAFNEPLANFQSAIYHLEQAGGIYRRLHLNKRYGSTLINLGNAVLELGRLENTEAQLDKTIRLFNQAHQVLASTKLPKEQATIQIGLGTAYRLLARHKNRLANLNTSIRALETAFNTLNAYQQPQEFLKVLCELGFTHSYSVDFTEPKYHLTKAAQYFKSALNNTLPQSPQDTIKIKYEYAHVLMKLSDYNQASQNLSEAIDLFESLREYYQHHASIEECVLLLNQLALCYQKLAEVLLTQKKDNLQISIGILNETLDLLNPEQNQLDYAMTQNNLGIAYSSLAKIANRQTNLKKARFM